MQEDIWNPIQPRFTKKSLKLSPLYNPITCESGSQSRNSSPSTRASPF